MLTLSDGELGVLYTGMTGFLTAHGWVRGETTHVRSTRVCRDGSRLVSLIRYDDGEVTILVSDPVSKAGYVSAYEMMQLGASFENDALSAMKRDGRSDADVVRGAARDALDDIIANAEGLL